MGETVERLSLWRGVLRVRLQRPTMAQVTARIAARYGTNVDELRGPSRARMIAWPRQEAMAACYEETGASETIIGQFFGRDHSTVSHARRAVTKRMSP